MQWNFLNAHFQFILSQTGNSLWSGTSLRMGSGVARFLIPLYWLGEPGQWQQDPTYVLRQN